MAPVKGSRKVHLTNLVEFPLRLDKYVDDSDDVIYFQNVLDRDFFKILLRKLRSHGITVKMLKDTDLMEEKMDNRGEEGMVYPQTGGKATCGGNCGLFPSWS